MTNAQGGMIPPTGKLTMWDVGEGKEAIIPLDRLGSPPSPGFAELLRLRAAVQEIRSLVMSTDGAYLDGSDFDGLVGEVQRVLREHDLLPDV